jgi:hypothetical protein
MEDPVYRDGAWWQRGTEPQWRRWEDGKWQVPKESDFPFPPPPPPPSEPSPPPKRHFWQVAVSEPFYVYLLGILAAIIALLITVSVVHDKTLVAGILAPVIGVIGAFTGHAAGHSSAVSVMKQTKT